MHKKEGKQKYSVNNSNTQHTDKFKQGAVCSSGKNIVL